VGLSKTRALASLRLTEIVANIEGSYSLRFSLRQLFVGIALATIVGYCGVITWKSVNGNYDELSTRLHADRRITDVKIWPIGQGIADLATDAYAVEFSIVGKPDSYIAIVTPKEDLFTTAQAMCIDRIGVLKLVASYKEKGSRGIAIGSVDVSSNSDLHDVLHLTVDNLGELIEHYDELLAGFKIWPTSTQPGVLQVSPDLQIEYYAATRQ